MFPNKEGMHDYFTTQNKVASYFLSAFKYQWSKLPDVVKFDKTSITFYISV